MDGSGDKSGGSTKRAVRGTVKAGLKFSVWKIGKSVSRRCCRKPVAYTAAIYTAAVLQYIVAEVLELAGNAARVRNNTQIHSSHIKRVLRNDDELAQLVAKVRPEEDPYISVEVDNIVTQLSRFELDRNDGVSDSSGRMDLDADSKPSSLATR